MTPPTPKDVARRILRAFPSPSVYAALGRLGSASESSHRLQASPALGRKRSTDGVEGGSVEDGAGAGPHADAADASAAKKGPKGVHFGQGAAGVPEPSATSLASELLQSPSAGLHELNKSVSSSGSEGKESTHHPVIAHDGLGLLSPTGVSSEVSAFETCLSTIDAALASLNLCALHSREAVISLAARERAKRASDAMKKVSERRRGRQESDADEYDEDEDEDLDGSPGGIYDSAHALAAGNVGAVDARTAATAKAALDREALLKGLASLCKAQVPRLAGAVISGVAGEAMPLAAHGRAISLMRLLASTRGGRAAVAGQRHGAAVRAAVVLAARMVRRELVDAARDQAAIAVREHVHSGARNAFGRLKRGISFSKGLESALAGSHGKSMDGTAGRAEPAAGSRSGDGPASAGTLSIRAGKRLGRAKKEALLSYLQHDDDEGIELPAGMNEQDTEDMPMTRLSVRGRGLWGLAAPVAEAPMPVVPNVSAAVHGASLPSGSVPPSEMAAAHEKQSSVYRHLAVFAAVDNEIVSEVADARVWSREQAAALRSEIAADVTLLLCQLARDEESRASLVVAGTAGALLNLVERKGFPPGVAQSALRALCMLAIDRDSTIETASGRQVTAAALAASAAVDDEVRQQVRALVRKRLWALLRLGGVGEGEGDGERPRSSSSGQKPASGEGDKEGGAASGTASDEPTKILERSPSDLAVIFQEALEGDASQAAASSSGR